MLSFPVGILADQFVYLPQISGKIDPKINCSSCSPSYAFTQHMSIEIDRALCAGLVIFLSKHIFLDIFVQPRNLSQGSNEKNTIMAP